MRGEGVSGFGIEAVDVFEEEPESRAEEIATLGEEVIDAGAGEFDVGGSVLDTEGHGGGADGDLQLVEEPAEVGIGDAIKNHEAGVEGGGLTGFGDVDGVGMAAGVVVLFEEGDVKKRMQEVGDAHSCNSGADDGEGRSQAGG